MRKKTDRRRTDWLIDAWLGLIAVLAAAVFIPAYSHADDLTECMAAKMPTVDDKTTIGELRVQCEKQIHEGKFKAQEKQDSLASERLRQDKMHVLQPFTLMAHKPNYILFAAYNSTGYNSKLYQEQANDPSLQADDTEAQFQVSIKVPLLVNLFEKVDVFAAYTNHSFWQVYNDSSAPFRETNHEPEAWVQFRPEWELFGFKNPANMFGIVHQSNGRGGVLSRSWNRLFANFVVERGNFAFNFKPWYRIPEDSVDDDNPDITDYLGHYEMRAAYKWRENVFSAMSRNNIESSFRRGAVELSWSFPLWNYPYLKGYIQYFNGYGESLIDYNQHVNKIGFGFAITDWM